MSPIGIDFGPCEQPTGFLFSHPCGEPGTVRCMSCAKLLCADHVATVDEKFLCKRCMLAEVLNDDSDGTTTTTTTTTTTDSGTAPTPDDPSYYYKDYGYYGRGSALGGGSSKDPNDFTEADGESLRHEDDASFEEDLGGS